MGALTSVGSLLQLRTIAVDQPPSTNPCSHASEPVKYEEPPPPPPLPKPEPRISQAKGAPSRSPRTRRPDCWLRCSYNAMPGHALHHPTLMVCRSTLRNSDSSPTLHLPCRPRASLGSLLAALWPVRHHYCRDNRHLAITSVPSSCSGSCVSKSPYHPSAIFLY